MAYTENGQQHLPAKRNETPGLSGSNLINIGWTERMISATLGTLLMSNGLGRLFNKPVSGLIRTALGGYLLYRGASGNCALYSKLNMSTNAAPQHAGSVNVRTTMVVNKPRAEVYRYWRTLENLPLFMKHLRSVKEHSDTLSHWEAVMPGNLGVIRWDATIVEDEENSKIAWQSTPGSTIENAGKVVFEDALGGQGTKLDILITYRPPAGDIGRGIATMLNSVVEKYIREDVAFFKTHIESVNNNDHVSANAGSSTERAYL